MKSPTDEEFTFNWFLSREAGSAEEVGEEHKFRRVHVAATGERVMERLAGIAKGDG